MNLLEGRFDRAAAAISLEGDTSLPLPAEVMHLLENYAEDRLVMGVRPENVRAAPVDGLRLSGRLTLREPLGNETITHVQLADREIIIRGNDEFVGDGDAVPLYVASRHLHLFSASSGVRIAGTAARTV